jgi:Uma2 family endonuclease
MLKYVEPLDWLPTADELPDSDETPVDNELQELIPSFLKSILLMLWEDRLDWFMGIDMGIYYDPDQPAIVPDGFLSLGVDRILDENLRLSYVLWQEKGILPQMVLEVVSKKYRGEYSTKKRFYQDLEIPYYVIYNSRRRRKPTLEVHKLINGEYIPVVGNPVWMPEVGLGIGKERYAHGGMNREWLFWYDEQGCRYPTPKEMILETTAQATQAQTQAAAAKARAEEEKARAEEEKARADRLADRLRQMGINPDEI